MLEFIMQSIDIIQIIILSVVGAFIGEFFRNVTGTNPLCFTKAVADFMASALIAVLLSLGAMEFVTKNKTLLAIISMYTGFMGYKVSSKYASKIWCTILDSILSNSKKKS